MLGKQLVYGGAGPHRLGSPGFLYRGMRLGMGLVNLFLLDKGNDPVLRFITPDVPFPVAAA